MRTILVVLLAGACAPTWEPAQGELGVADDTVVAPEGPSFPPILWPGCEQEAATLGGQHHPFVWDMSTVGGTDHPCRHGCTMTPAEPSGAAPGIEMTLLDGGEIAIRSLHPQARWERRLAGTGFAPDVVRWTSWCGDAITIAAHDRRFVRVVSLASATGDVLDEFERTLVIDGQPDPAFDVQLHCWDLRTAVHARGTQGAWTLDSPRSDPAERPRDVPAEVFDRLRAQPHAGGSPITRREVRRTRTRVHHRVGRELFALDHDGAPLWHREATAAWVGCLQGTQLMRLVGCSRCPTPSESLTTAGEYVFLEVYDLGSSTDVFDADGRHLAYISR